MPSTPSGRARKRNVPDVSVADSTREALQLAFGENFRRARIKAGLTQRDIEIQTGIRQAYISQVESGTQNLTLATMTVFAIAVGKDVPTMLKQPAVRAKRK